MMIMTMDELTIVFTYCCEHLFFDKSPFGMQKVSYAISRTQAETDPSDSFSE